MSDFISAEIDLSGCLAYNSTATSPKKCHPISCARRSISQFWSNALEEMCYVKILYNLSYYNDLNRQGWNSQQFLKSNTDLCIVVDWHLGFRPIFALERR